MTRRASSPYASPPDLAGIRVRWRLHRPEALIPHPPDSPPRPPGPRPTATVGPARGRRGRRVLYVTYDGLLEPLGASQVVPYVTGLSRRGFPMDVLSWEKPGDLRDRETVREMETRLRDANVRWLRRRYHRRPRLAATAFDVVAGVVAGGVAGGTAPPLVHARSYVAGAVALAASTLRGSRFLFDMRGFWVDERIEAGLWRPDSATVWLMRRLERRLLGRSDAVTVLTRAGAAALRNEYPLPSDTPIHVVPTCVDLDRFRPAPDPDEARRRKGLPKGPVVVYVGSLSTWYLAETTIAVGLAFARLGGGHFLLLTREEELARRLLGDARDSVTVRSIAHAELPEWLAGCDAGLAPVVPVPSKRASAPTKVGEYLACGLAVAATAGVGDLDEQLAATAAGFTFEPSEDPGAVAERLLDRVRRPGRAEAARALARRHYPLDDGIRAYADLYRALGATGEQEGGP